MLTDSLLPCEHCGGLRCAALRYGARVQIRTHKLELLDNNLRQEARKSIFELAGEPVCWRTAAGLRMH
jgi:hypothetical protein